MAELIETVSLYGHIAGNNTFTVTDAERWSISMIRRLHDKFPDDVIIVYTNDYGSIVAHVPFEWMRIVPKKRITITEERRKALADRLHTAQVGKNTANFD